MISAVVVQWSGLLFFSHTIWFSIVGLQLICSLSCTIESFAILCMLFKIDPDFWWSWRSWICIEKARKTISYWQWKMLGPRETVRWKQRSFCSSGHLEQLRHHVADTKEI